MAAFKQRHAQKELVEIAALNTMLKANEKWLDTLVPNLHSKEDLGTDTRPFVIRKWRREDAKATDA
jgi:hypothetical protein